MSPQLIAIACKHSYNVATVVVCVPPETSNLTEMAESVDDTLFQRKHNPYHVLHGRYLGLEPEIAPLDPPSTKTPPYNQT